MEVHSFFCDVCNQEFAESELMTLQLPVWNSDDRTVEYYNDESMRHPFVCMKKMDICDDCLIKATVMQEVDTGKALFIKDSSPCPEDAHVDVFKYSSKMTTRHGEVVKKRGE